MGECKAFLIFSRQITQTVLKLNKLFQPVDSSDSLF